MLGTTDIIAFVPTTDGAKARAFYEGILGLRFISDDGFALVFNANGIMIRIVKVQQLTPVQYTILGWQVKEIEKVVASMQERGVHFERYGFFNKTTLEFGPHRVETRWHGSKIQTGTHCRCQSTSV